MTDEPEKLLPKGLLARASFRGNEYAWSIHNIPEVIDAARAANLASLGGQLQFRLPDAICECYWIEVDTAEIAGDSLSWPQVVEKSATVALSDFENILQDVDLLVEGLKAFPDYDADELSEAMCFVWYLQSRPVS
jgi:hypothetical protein